MPLPILRHAVRRLGKRIALKGDGKNKDRKATPALPEG